MRVHRFIGEFNFFDHHVSVADKEVIHQLFEVLKLRKGEKIILCDGNLNEVLAEIEDINKEQVKAKILEAGQNKNEPANHVVLYCSILKRTNFDWAVQKAVEAGAKEIVPLIAGRTVKLLVRDERLGKIVKEAAEQSGRGILPKLRQAMAFEKALEQAKSNNLNLFFDERGEDVRMVLDSCRSLPRAESRGGNDKIKVKKIGIFVGPEGGWEEKELGLARAAKNFKIVSMGKLTLRSETAAVVATYLACSS